MSTDRFAAVHRLAASLADAAPARHTSSADITSLMPFLALARELAALIVPVQPREAYRDALGRNLVTAARQQYARERLMISPAAAEPSGGARRWVVGAATVGSAVSLMGLVAFAVYRRRRQAA